MNAPNKPEIFDKGNFAEWSLHHGGSDRALALIIPDVWPDMYRVRWPDGAVSDLTNLTRAKDAACAIAERDGRNRHSLRWKCVGEARAASPMRLNRREG